MKILYCILTSHKLNSHREWLETTWLKNKNYLYYSDENNINTIKVSNDDTYHSNEEKQINILNYIIVHLNEFNYDWFCFCDTDTWIYTQKLENVIHTLDSNIVYGELTNKQINPSNRIFNFFPNLQYLSGGAGWIISKHNLKEIKKFDNFKTGYSDVSVGINLTNKNIMMQNLKGLCSKQYDQNTNFEDYLSFHYMTERKHFEELNNNENKM